MSCAWRIFDALLPVPREAGRRDLEDRAIKNSWSKTRLRLEIKGTIPSHKPWAGRRPRPLHDATEVHARLGELALTCHRFREEMARFAQTKPLQLSGAVEDHLAAADRAFAGLAKIINRKVRSKSKTTATPPIQARAARVKTPK